MPNQSKSLNEQESSGITGPIEAMWQHWLANYALEGIDDTNREAVRYCFYCAAVSTYNAILQSFREDASMNLMVMLTGAMKQNFEEFFQTSSIGQTLN